MWRYAIAFGFDGTAYHGWQIQPNGMSVQQKLQEALGLVLRKDILVVGAGRTDAGVHARKMTAHFDLDEEIACEQLAYRLNRVLPKDIAVYDVKRVNEDFHARFSAVKRTYHYYIHLRKDPFRRHYSYELHACPDFKLMNTAAAYLLEARDFAAFCKSKSDAKTTICRVMAARWIQETEHCWFFAQYGEGCRGHALGCRQASDNLGRVPQDCGLGQSVCSRRKRTGKRAVLGGCRILVCG